MKSIALILMPLLLSGCFYVSKPFSESPALKDLPDDATVMAAVTPVKLGDDSEKNDVFWEYSEKVVESLETQPGYLGHRLRLRLLSGEAWTMTVWRDEPSLNNFVRGEVHMAAIIEGTDAVAEGRFVRFPVPRSEAPPSWETVERMMDEQGRGMC